MSGVAGRSFGLLLASLLGGVLVACNGGPRETPSDTAPADASPTEASTPAATTPTGTVRPGPAPDDDIWEGFRQLAAGLEEALADGEVAFLLERAIEEEITCEGDEEVGVCAGREQGEDLQGIPSAVYQSDAFALYTPGEYGEVLAEWLAMAAPDGTPTLRALARRDQEDGGEGTYLAIAHGRFLIGPEDAKVLRQQGRVFEFERVGDSWRFSGEVYLSVPESTDPWTSGDCNECYDYWEVWEGE